MLKELSDTKRRKSSASILDCCTGQTSAAPQNLDCALQLATQYDGHKVEGWRIRKNSTPFFVTGTLTAIRGEDKNLIGFAHVLRDATERRDAQEKLVEAREQLVTA